MSCKRCYSHNQSDFGGEVAMHFPGLKGLDKPIVWVFPELKVCLDCASAISLFPNASCAS
jgi:hypothetical protein